MNLTFVRGCPERIIISYTSEIRNENEKKNSFFPGLGGRNLLPNILSIPSSIGVRCRWRLSDVGPSPAARLWCHNKVSASTGLGTTRAMFSLHKSSGAAATRTSHPAISPSPTKTTKTRLHHFCSPPDSLLFTQPSCSFLLSVSLHSPPCLYIDLSSWIVFKWVMSLEFVPASINSRP